MQCKYEPCINEAKGNSQYCSKSCRAQHSRAKKHGATAKTFTRNEGQVYGRQSVSYTGDKWETRPMPLDDSDQPHTGGRGKYTRQDGTTYQFDSSGNVQGEQELVDQEPASLEDYQAEDGRKYAQRSNPLVLNWGTPMSLNELNSAGLKGNRVAIPGDWDFIRVSQ